MPQYLSARALVRTGRSEPPVYCLRHNAVDTANLWFQEHFPCPQYRLEHVLHICTAPTPLDNVLHDGYRFILQFSATLITAGILESSRQIRSCWRS